MRNLFIVGLKLLGILCFYWLFGTMGQIGIALTSMRSFSSMGINPLWYFLAFAAYLLIEFVFALLFLFRSEAIASLLGVTDNTTASVQISGASLLFAALVGVSVFILLESTPKLLQEFFYILQAHQGGRAPDDYQVSALIATIVQITLAFVVISRAKTMAIKLLPQKN
ncbi:MAG: hypothetical protein ABIP97_09085 [Chthoniobacterales bacterium]